jgi:ribosomal protein S18 acetylase RimI-like enzyme
MATGAPVPLAPDQAEAAGRMAVRAFMDEPGMLFVSRNEKRRGEMLSALMPAVIRFGCEFGEVYTTPGEPRGVAVWLPPAGRAAVSYERMRRTGLVRALLRHGPGELARLWLLSLHTGALDPESYRKPHWYLWMLAVDPAHQRQGIGSALMGPVLAQADAEGLPCALDTHRDGSERLYRRHGFEVVKAQRCPFGGPHARAMWREPRHGLKR